MMQPSRCSSQLSAAGVQDAIHFGLAVDEAVVNFVGRQRNPMFREAVGGTAHLGRGSAAFQKKEKHRLNAALKGCATRVGTGPYGLTAITARRFW
jgi:hypothetical protein